MKLFSVLNSDIRKSGVAISRRGDYWGRPRVEFGRWWVSTKMELLSVYKYVSYRTLG